MAVGSGGVAEKVSAGPASSKRKATPPAPENGGWSSVEPWTEHVAVPGRYSVAGDATAVEALVEE